MICLYCNSELEIPDNAFRNMETYHQSVRTVTGCCGKIVRVKPRMTFAVTTVDPSITVDDWGNESA